MSLARVGLVPFSFQPSLRDKHLRGLPGPERRVIGKRPYETIPESPALACLSVYVPVSRRAGHSYWRNFWPPKKTKTSETQRASGRSSNSPPPELLKHKVSWTLVLGNSTVVLCRTT